MMICMQRNTPILIILSFCGISLNVFVLGGTVSGYHHKDANAAKKCSLLCPVGADVLLFFASDQLYFILPKIAFCRGIMLLLKYVIGKCQKWLLLANVNDTLSGEIYIVHRRCSFKPYSALLTALLGSCAYTRQGYRQEAYFTSSQPFYTLFTDIQ